MIGDTPKIMSLQADFELTTAEYREAVRAINARNLRRSFRRPAGWILFAILVVAIVLIRRAHSTSTPPPLPHSPISSPTPSLLLDFLLPLIPWILIFGFIWFFVFRLLRTQKNSRMLNCVWSLTVDETGVTLSQPIERIERKWEAFSEFGQSKQLFLLYITKSAAVPIPKRAFKADDAELFQQMASRRIHPKISAFPVVPSRDESASR